MEKSRSEKWGDGRAEGSSQDSPLGLCPSLPQVFLCWLSAWLLWSPHSGVAVACCVSPFCFLLSFFVSSCIKLQIFRFQEISKPSYEIWTLSENKHCLLYSLTLEMQRMTKLLPSSIFSFSVSFSPFSSSRAINSLHGFLPYLSFLLTPWYQKADRSFPCDCPVKSAAWMASVRNGGVLGCRSTLKPCFCKVLYYRGVYQCLQKVGFHI